MAAKKKKAAAKVAKMNLAVRGLSANLGEVPADTFFKEQHPDLKADFSLANPPLQSEGLARPRRTRQQRTWERLQAHAYRAL